MEAERIRFSGFAPIPRLSLSPRFQWFICMGKYFREIQVPRFQRFPDSRGFTVFRYIRARCISGLIADFHPSKITPALKFSLRQLTRAYDFFLTNLSSCCRAAYTWMKPWSGEMGNLSSRKFWFGYFSLN